MAIFNEMLGGGLYAYASYGTAYTTVVPTAFGEILSQYATSDNSHSEPFYTVIERGFGGSVTSSNYYNFYNRISWTGVNFNSLCRDLFVMSDGTTIMFGKDSSNCLVGCVFYEKPYITKATNIANADGIALTSGTSNSTIQVSVPAKRNSFYK